VPIDVNFLDQVRGVTIKDPVAVDVMWRVNDNKVQGGRRSFVS